MWIIQVQFIYNVYISKNTCQITFDNLLETNLINITSNTKEQAIFEACHEFIEYHSHCCKKCSSMNIFKFDPHVESNSKTHLKFCKDCGYSWSVLQKI